MEVYYVIGLDDDWKPQHTMRIASREPVTQDNISAAFKNAYAKFVIAQEVSGMGVSVESATNDRQAALEALDAIEIFKGTSDYNHQNLGAFIWPFKSVIRAALTAQDVNAELLEAVKALKKRLKFKNSSEAKYYSSDDSFWIDLADKAIARAEQKGGV